MQLEQLGPYKIIRQLGRGGMGTVYEGTLRESGEPAAIKILSATLAHDDGFRERFKSEIETLRKLRHPNIVRLYGYGEEDNHLFYAMELIVGRSLEDVIIEKQRQVLIPGFADVRAGALERGALGCSISGAGPTLFALCLERDTAAVRDAMVGAFAKQGIATDKWIVPVQSGGAHVVSSE